MRTKSKVEQSVLDQAMIPGLSIGYCQKAQRKTMMGGVANTKTLTPVDDITLFQAASLSKPVSAAIILSLAEQGLLDLDRALSEYDDYAQYATHDPSGFRQDPYYHHLTARMVIAQCSGLPNWFPDESKEAFISKPGARFTYSGVAYYFLQKVIENKLGRSWESLAQIFFSKVGMTHSTFEKPEWGRLKNCVVAQGHSGNGEPEAAPCASQDSAVVPAGSLLTTGNDYVVFLQYCLNDPYLKAMLFSSHTKLDSDELVKTPEAARSITWGLGMGVLKISGRDIGFHWGNHPHSHAFCAIDIKTGDAVACFVNSSNGPNVFQSIAESVVGDLRPVFQLLSTYCGFNAETPIKEKIKSPIPCGNTNTMQNGVGQYRRYMCHTHSSFFKVKDKQQADFPPPPRYPAVSR